MPVTEIPGMVTFAQFADPEGNIVGLVKSEPEQRRR
jgi:predicted enzyme related to lactoylglutathione lyase